CDEVDLAATVRGPPIPVKQHVAAAAQEVRRNGFSCRAEAVFREAGWGRFRCRVRGHVPSMPSTGDIPLGAYAKRWTTRRHAGLWTNRSGGDDRVEGPAVTSLVERELLRQLQVAGRQLLDVHVL